jgi:predicted Rossmann-fold nucleotide-binding protein
LVNGLLNELGEIITLMQTKKIDHVPIFLFGSDFWKPLDAFFYWKMEKEAGTIGPNDRALYTITDDVNVIVNAAGNVSPRQPSELISQVLDGQTNSQPAS